MKGAEITPRDALDMAKRALQNNNELISRVEELEAAVREGEKERAALQLRLSEIDEQRDYAALSLEEKVGMVREHMFRKAAEGHGKSSLDYNGVMWEVFDGDPSPAHCYKLMERAATAPGFRYDEGADPKRVTCDADIAVSQAGAFYSENKATTEGGSVR